MSTPDPINEVAVEHQTVLAVADLIRDGRERGRTSINIALSIASAGWLRTAEDRADYWEQQRYDDAIHSEVERLRAENEALRKAITQQQDRRRRLVNQLARGRKKRKKLHDQIARYRNVVNAAIALRLHDCGPDRTVVPSDDWWTVHRRLSLALADATDDALAAAPSPRRAGDMSTPDRPTWRNVNYGESYGWAVAHLLENGDTSLMHCGSPVFTSLEKAQRHLRGMTALGHTCWLVQVVKVNSVDGL